MKRPTLLACLLIGLLSISCTGTTGENGTSSETQVAPKYIPSAEAVPLLADSTVITIDVRTSEEVAAGYILGADMFMDVNAPDFAQKIAELDKTKTYLVYCHSGKRSAKASTIMTEAGFTNVYNMTSGYGTWTGPVTK